MGTLFWVVEVGPKRHYNCPLKERGKVKMEAEIGAVQPYKSRNACSHQKLSHSRSRFSPRSFVEIASLLTS